MFNYQENVLERRGTSGRDHIPALPFWLAIVRVAQLILAFLVLVLAAYADSVFGGNSVSSFINDAFPGYAMSFFTFAWTVLFFLYIFLTPLAFPQFYLSYAHIGLEFLTVIFWLTSFALLADESKYWSDLQDILSREKKTESLYGVDYSNGQLNKWITAAKASRAATGLAAIVWLLFMFTLGFVVFFWNKHRAEHGGTGFSFGGTRGPTTDPEAAQVEKTHVPVELHNVQGQPSPPAVTADA